MQLITRLVFYSKITDMKCKQRDKVKIFARQLCHIRISWLYFSSRDMLFTFLSKNDAKTLCIEHLLNAKTVTCTEPHDVIHGRVKAT